jgi:hypothetical protein
VDGVAILTGFRQVIGGTAARSIDAKLVRIRTSVVHPANCLLLAAD